MTFPGIIDDPGSFSGSKSSPNPLLGPDPKNLMSFAIFIKLPASVLSAPWKSNNESCVAKASNLLGAVLKGCPVRFAISSATNSANPS